MEITKGLLNFVEEAKQAFENDKQATTYRDWNEEYIALRTSVERNDITVYKIAEPAKVFTGQLQPCPFPREVILDFGYEMESGLKENRLKYGWDEVKSDYLESMLFQTQQKLNEELSRKSPYNFSKTLITQYCAEIALYSMMIADKKGAIQ